MFRDIDSRVEIVAQQEFAEIREWYYEMSADERQRFKQDFEALAKIQKRMEDMGVFVGKVDWSRSQHDDEGNEIYSVGAKQSPKKWLEAIKLWDELEQFAKE